MNHRLPIEFNAFTTELETGLSLIEASAGTGKTFAIAMLVLRFVVEKDIAVENILVVTFTKAATEELKGRIRGRLAQAKQALQSVLKPALKTDSSGDDSENLADMADLADWVASLTALSISPEEALKRIELALLSIDLAGIYTIHGFCASALKSFALESGQTFDAELTHSVDSLKQTVAEDFWRDLVYPLSADKASLITQFYETPQKLLDSVASLDTHLTSLPEVSRPRQALRDALDRVASLKDVAHQAWPSYVNKLSEGLAGFNKPVVGNFAQDAEAIGEWLAGTAPAPKNLGLLSEEFLSSNVNKRRKGYESHVERLGLSFTPFQALLKTLKIIPILVKQALLETLDIQVAQRSLEANQMSFNDLIRHLAAALQADNKHALIQALQTQYRVALIDEFQDTDSEQWAIFSTLFANPASYCFLIGDPKQAIYKFRGADIYAYFSAQKQADREYTLAYNWRSHPEMVSGVNQLFLAKETEVAYPFSMQGLRFLPVKAGKKVSDGALLQGQTPQVGLKLWQFEPPEGKDFWTSVRMKSRICDEVVAEILSLLAQNTQIQTPEGKRDLQLEDIAILIASKTQAQAYQVALRQAGLPSVSSSVRSVFDSPQAKILHTLCDAIAHPMDLMKAKRALVLPWFKVNGQAYLALLADAQAFDDWMLQLQVWHQIWQQKGILVMLVEVLASEMPGSRQPALSLQASLIEQADGERQLTDLWHLGELIQTQANEAQWGVFKTLDWFAQALKDSSQSGVQGDAAQMRLETDDNAIRIMTMHVAKGLEFPVVFCPDVVVRNDMLKKESEKIIFHNGTERVVDLGSDSFELNKKRALVEELSEQIRLLYVAVTRAKYLCYLPTADIRSSKASPMESALAHLMKNCEATLALPESVIEVIGKKADSPEILPYQKPIVQQAFILPEMPEVTSKYWRLSSYSSLAHSGHLPMQQQVSEELDDIEVTDAEVVANETDIEADIETGVEKNTQPSDNRFANLPKGADFGSCLHDLFENCTFQEIEHLSGNYPVLKQQKMDFYGVACSESQQNLFDEMMQHTVLADLSAGQGAQFSLAQLSPLQCLKEMPFYLSVPGLKVSQLNSLLASSPVCQPIGAYDMQGYLTGFIDLICEHNGQYFVMDYKSNYLEAYDDKSLQQAMQSHNYGLQLWIYSLVLHRYCQQRIENYDYDTHFGGVRYLFTRGMAEGTTSGVYATKLSLSEINDLADVLEAKA